MAPLLFLLAAVAQTTVSAAVSLTEALGRCREDLASPRSGGEIPRVRFLRTPPALTIFEKHGFTPVTDAR